MTTAMPELPEVETMRRGVLPVVGACIRSVQRVPTRCKPIEIRPAIASLRRRIVGQCVEAVERVGKRVAVVLESRVRLVFEPRMTGLVLLADPPDREHLRLQLELDGEVDRLMYWDRRGLGSVRLFTPSQFGDQFGPERLGPDALDVTSEELRSRFRSSRRAVKVALLDQRALAGIGNLYASEILHVAGIHPAQRCDRLSRPQWGRVHRAMQDVLAEAIRYEGSTLGDGTYRNALNQEGSYQNHHRVYGRAGEPYPRCQRAIRRVIQAQRSTFYCAGCQRR